MKQALSGVKVVEYCEMVSGPYCTKLLADLGAETIKIEKPGSGDPARSRGPFLNDVPHPDRSGLFLYLNTNKLGVTLNPETATGREIFRNLVKDCDVLVEDTTPGTMERLGLDYESLRATNPGLIMTSVTPFGQTGPYKGYKAYNLNVCHASGEGYITPGWSKFPGREPLQAGGMVSDYDAGLAASLATLIALYGRLGDGVGRHVDVSRQEACLALEKVIMCIYPNEGIVPNRFVGSGRALKGGVMPCRDGHIVLLTTEPHQWQALVKLIGEPEWVKEVKFQDEFAPPDEAEKINSRITEWMLQHDKDEIYRKGQALGCPVAPVCSMEDIVKSEQLKARGFFAEIDHPETGKLKYPTAPYQFSETPWAARRPAPRLGEHNHEIYCNHLGLSPEDLAKLRQTGVI